MIDSDGCIRWSGTPQVTVTGCFAPLMKTLVDQFGGRCMSGGRNVPGERPVWRWQTTGNKAMAVIRFVLDDLFEKKPQAAIVVAMRALKPGAPRDALQVQLSSLKQQHYHLKPETK